MICRECGGVIFEMRWNDVLYHKCSRCGALQEFEDEYEFERPVMNRKVIAIRSKEIKTWRKYMNSYDKLLLLNSYRKLIYKDIPNLADYILKNKKIANILDYGCGTGNAVRGLMKKFRGKKEINFLGIDINDKALSFAKNKFKNNENVNFMNFDLANKNNELKNPKQDLIVMNNVFYCLNDTQKITLLNNFKKILKPGGVILLAEPNEMPRIKRYYKIMKNEIKNNCIKNLLKFTLNIKHLYNIIKTNRYIKNNYEFISTYTQAKMFRDCGFEAMNAVSLSGYAGGLYINYYKMKRN